MEPLEQKEQKAVVKWARKQGFIVNSVGNGGVRKVQEVVRDIAMGELPGMPDLEFPIQGGQTIRIEMKRRKKGVISKKQEVIHAELEKRGHIVKVARGAKEAVDFLKQFLHLT
jgi:hypothetical protein